MPPPPAHRARRRLLAGGVGAATMLLVRPLAAAPDALAAAISAFTGGVPAQGAGIALDVARLVDNGNAVPVTVAVESTMSATDRVVVIALFNERNPQREVALFEFGPRAGRAVVSTRIRLATSQRLAAVARMSDGSYLLAAADVVVALAACIEEME